MADMMLADVFDLIRARKLRHVAERTRREMARLPSHLVDDVNARGLPAILPPVVFRTKKANQIIDFKTRSRRK